MSKKDIKKVKNKNEEIKEKQEEKQEEIKNSEVELLGNRIKELEEKLVRNQAELINYKRRKDDEVSRMLKYSQEDIILEILPIIDNFERAIKLDDNNCDILDAEFPLETALISQLIELTVTEIKKALYDPEDIENNANDDLSNLVAFIRNNMKSNLQKQIEG